MGRVEGKVAMVTGGASGIGKATCMRLAEEGARLMVTDVDEEQGTAVVDAVRDKGGEAKFFALDVADEKNVQEAVAETVSAWGQLDVLVNNAGIAGTDAPTHELTEEQWDKVMAVNVKGVFFCTKHAVPRMRKTGGGSIVNLSSIYGLVSAADVPPYHASKGAVRLMTKTDALLYAKDGIRVNSVHPGFVWTSMVEGFARQKGQDPEAFREQLGQLHPVGHPGEPDDIAWGIVFLASDESKFMTGSEVVIDGGYTCK